MFIPSFFVEIILYKDFGKNYLFDQNKSKLLIIFLVPIADYFEPLISPFSKNLIYFLVICGIRALFEIARTNINERNKKRIHSYSSGEPLEIWKLLTRNRYFTRVILQPALVGVIAIVLIHFNWDIVFGYVLALCAFSLFLKESFYLKRAKIFTQSIEDSKLVQENINNGNLLPNYDNKQEDKLKPSIQEMIKVVMEEAKSYCNWRL